jgi:DNA-binding response OmpR family regulator
MKKIFIADDNQDLLELMHTIFHRDYLVSCCSNAENVFLKIHEFEPDLVILDNFLGDINAETLIEKLKKKDSLFSIPFLLFSAHPSIKKIAAKLGADGYIEKPFTVKDVKSYVNAIIQGFASDVHS